MIEWLPFDLGQYAHFHFLRPWWLLSLIPTLLCLWLLSSTRNPVAKWRSVIAPHLLNAMLVPRGRASWFNPASVTALIVVLAGVAMAGPTWKQQASPFSEDIAALVIALDVSSSMQQTDIQPSRLERAKQKVHDLMSLRPGGRVGLIVYSGTAHSVIPLTNDADVINNFLSAITTTMMPRNGKFPEKALVIAERMLQDSPVPGTVLLITDGLGPQSTQGFNDYFASRNHQLLVLGIGTESADKQGLDDTLIPLERAALSKLARSSGGVYQSLTLDKKDVRNLNRRINNHLVIVDDGSRPWVDAGYYLLFPYALFWLLWFRKGWTLQWCIALIFIASLGTPQTVSANESVLDNWGFVDRFMALWLTPDQQGRYYLEKGDYKTAAVKFEDIGWRGVAYYRAENFEAAAEMFSRIESATGYFNLANALAHGRHYVLAVKAYNKVLELQAGHAGATKNRDFIQAIIDEINLMSASQKAEPGDSSKELGEDQAQTADGATRDDIVEAEIEQLTAEQILQDEQLNETWMRQVQKDPSRFLKVKFYMQLQAEQDNASK